MTEPQLYRVAWRDLLPYLTDAGKTMRVRAYFEPLGAELDWIASAGGLNRFGDGGECTATWYPEGRDVLLAPVEVPARLTVTLPAKVYRAVAEDQARRWAYAETLGADELAEYLRSRVGDVNLRADVDVVWRLAAEHFSGRTA